jgi:hypothetical protein
MSAQITAQSLHNRLHDSSLVKLNQGQQGRAMRQVTEFKLAEREGFEPSVQVLARTTV